MNTEKVTKEIDKITDAVYQTNWHKNPPTKKAMREIEALGLTAFISKSRRYAPFVNAIIEAANDAGNKKASDVRYGSTMGLDDVTVWTSKPSALYLAIHEGEE